MPQRQFTYDKYLTAKPTALMDHIEQWIKDMTGFDPSQARTKADAFAMGVRLTVALRNHHQESEENQTRLAENRQAANERDKAAIAKREARLSMGVAPRGRLPKTVAEDKAAEPAPEPKRRGRPKKEAQPAPEPVAEETPAPKRRGRPRKVTAPVPEEAPTNVTPIRRRAAKPAATAEDAAPVATGAKPTRRRPVRRKGEAAF